MTGDTEIYRDGKVHVRAQQCANCLLGPDRLVPGARARALIADTRAADGSSFICHRSQVTNTPPAICRAWFDRFADEDWMLRLATDLGVIEYASEPGD